MPPLLAGLGFACLASGLVLEDGRRTRIGPPREVFRPGRIGVPHEQFEPEPLGWTRLGDAVEDEPLNLRVYMKHAHHDYIKIAEDVSNPASENYGRYLDADALRLALANTEDSSKNVLDWLKSKSVEAYTVGQDWIDFTTTAGHANGLFDADFGAYAHDDEEPILRTTRYSLPSDLAEHIDFVFPTVHFFTSANAKRRVDSLTRRQHIPSGPANCTNSACPAEISKKYNITYRPKDATSGSQIAIAGFIKNFPNITDVKAFLAKYGIDKKTTSLPKINITSIANGTTKIPSDGGALTVEAELDLDYSIAFTGPLPVTFYSVGGAGEKLSQPGNKPVPASKSDNEPYLVLLQYLLAQKNPPQVLSISYSDDEQSVPALYASKVCALFAQAAARGISVIGASGDGGAAGTGTSADCIGPDGKHRFIPTFPSSCPWITSVGATGPAGNAASFSSGGFSNYFGRPTWQAANVSSYITELNGTHKGMYNTTGRAIPDVSLLGDDYLTLTGGYPLNHDGTSASTPVFAAMVALINDIRLRNKKPVVGFLNPTLYAAKAKSVYRDVADDSFSDGCSDGNYFTSGWPALKGWDAATGLGEPDFLKLKALLA